MLRQLKANPSVIVRAHLASYRDDRTGKVLARDHLLFEAVPLAVGLVLSLLARFRLSVPASGGLLAVMGLLGALLFGVMILITDRAMSWSDNPQDPGEETVRYAIFLRELAANAGYASLVCIAAAVVFVCASATSGWALIAFSALGIALGLHLVLVVLMVMKRTYALTHARLTEVITGGGGRGRDYRGRRAS